MKIHRDKMSGPVKADVVQNSGRTILDGSSLGRPTTGIRMNQNEQAAK